MNEPETEAADESPSEVRERLEHEADAVRERLGERLNALNERRRRVANAFDVAREEVKRHPVPFILLGIGITAGLGTILYRKRAKARRAKVPLQIARAITDLFGVPNAATMAPHPSEPSLAKKALARVGDALFSAAVGEIGRRSASYLSRERAY